MAGMNKDEIENPGKVEASSKKEKNKKKKRKKLSEEKPKTPPLSDYIVEGSQSFIASLSNYFARDQRQNIHQAKKKPFYNHLEKVEQETGTRGEEQKNFNALGAYSEEKEYYFNDSDDSQTAAQKFLTAFWSKPENVETTNFLNPDRNSAPCISFVTAELNGQKVCFIGISGTMDYSLAEAITKENLVQEGSYIFVESTSQQFLKTMGETVPWLEGKEEFKQLQICAEKPLCCFLSSLFSKYGQALRITGITNCLFYPALSHAPENIGSFPVPYKEYKAESEEEIQAEAKVNFAINYHYKVTLNYVKSLLSNHPPSQVLQTLTEGGWLDGTRETMYAQVQTEYEAKANSENISNLSPEEVRAKAKIDFIMQFQASNLHEQVKTHYEQNMSPAQVVARLQEEKWIDDTLETTYSENRYHYENYVRTQKTTEKTGRVYRISCCGLCQADKLAFMNYLYFMYQEGNKKQAQQTTHSSSRSSSSSSSSSSTLSTSTTSLADLLPIIIPDTTQGLRSSELHSPLETSSFPLPPPVEQRENPPAPPTLGSTPEGRPTIGGISFSKGTQ